MPRHYSKGKLDMAISNALGSYVFDFCFCLGLPFFIQCLMTGSPVDTTQPPTFAVTWRAATAALSHQQCVGTTFLACT